MSRVFVTSGGKFGDAIWSLATVKAIKQSDPKRFLTFGVGSPWIAILPVAGSQPYVDAVWKCPDPGFVDPNVCGFADVCSFQVQVPDGPDAWDEVVQIGWRRLPDPSKGDHNAVVMAEATPYRPKLSEPWLSKSPDVVEPQTLAIALHDTTNTYGQPWLKDMEARLPAMIQDAGFREVRFIGGPDAEPVHRGLEKTWSRRYSFATKMHGCCFLCAAYLMESSEAFLGFDSAIHAIACGMGMPTLTLRRNRFNISAPWSTQIDFDEETPKALDIARGWFAERAKR